MTLTELIETARYEERDVGLDEVWEAYGEDMRPTVQAEHPLARLIRVLDDCEGSGDESKEELARSLIWAELSLPYEWIEAAFGIEKTALDSELKP